MLITEFIFGDGLTYFKIDWTEMGLSMTARKDEISKMDAYESFACRHYRVLDIFEFLLWNNNFSSKVDEFICAIFCLAGMGGDILC